MARRPRLDGGARLVVVEVDRRRRLDAVQAPEAGLLARVAGDARARRELEGATQEPDAARDHAAQELVAGESERVAHDRPILPDEPRDPVGDAWETCGVPRPSSQSSSGSAPRTTPGSARASARSSSSVLMRVARRPRTATWTSW